MNNVRILVRFRDDCKEELIKDFQLNHYTHIADINDSEVSLIIGTDDLRLITDIIEDERGNRSLSFFLRM